MAATLRNPYEGVRSAGLRKAGKDEAVEYCLRDPERPPTPPKIREYGAVLEPGARAAHFGYRAGKGPDHARDMAHGHLSRPVGAKAESTHSLLDMSTTPMQEMITRKAEERAYLSVKREPLGSTAVPGGVVLPAETRRPDFRFGATKPLEEDVKSLVFPVGTAPGEEAGEALYMVSHKTFPVGARRRDGVDWSITGVDPETATFGSAPPPLEKAAAERCVNPLAEAAATSDKLSATRARAAASAGSVAAAGGLTLPRTPAEVAADAAAASAAASRVSAALTRLVPKGVADVKAAEEYPLGMTRGRPAADLSAHPPIYGRRSQRREAGEWSAADCMRGDYSREEQEPDRDLGRSVTQGFRHAGFADPARRFGLPSVRSDVPPRNTSVATLVDFGDGTCAASLLAPSAYAEHGVDEGDFTAPRQKAKLRALFAAIGTEFADAEFEAVWNRASLMGRFTPVGQVCLQEFREVLNEVLAARDAGSEPEWFTRAVDGGS